MAELRENTKMMELADLRALAAAYQQHVISFCQRLIQTPSLPGDEGRVAKLVQEEMQLLGYDEVWVDRVGNVIGWMRGRGGRSIMLNCHLDHVAPGDESQWPFPPTSGRLEQGAIWGRGASDIKGPLAVQVYSVGTLRKTGFDFPGDVYVVGVVMEEVGGLGTRALLKEVRPDFAILGEATGNQIARGHRGRVEVIVQVRGRAAHASVPQQGVNPHYSLARFLLRLQEIPMAQDPEFGPATVAPTLYVTDQESSNVIPDQVRLHLDWRNIPGQSPEEILAQLQVLLEESLEPGSEGWVEVQEDELVTYTGYTQRLPDIVPSYALPADHPLVTEARRALEEALERPVAVITWQFATDGGHLMEAGIPTIGFSPGQEHLVHTNQERIRLDMIREAFVGYGALVQHLGSL
jgi:succinyl-diaminopimelate desuccinylase